MSSTRSCRTLTASFHPWKSRHMTTRSCASTYVTPQPLWRGLVIVVVVVQLMLPPHCEGDWHRLLLSPTCVVTPPTQWTRLCGAPTIAPYCPWQQPVRTCQSPCLGMAAHLQFQGLPLPASLSRERDVIRTVSLRYGLVTRLVTVACDRVRY
jgi:hypothetical protein